jgi:tRNA-2-methylthio-N6-dimethylallyladenosine synthase
VVLNTCHIRERASEKVFSELGKLRQIKLARAAAGRDTIIAVAGCVAQAEGAEILRRQKAVDLVVGPQNYHRLPQLVAQARLRPGVVDTEFPAEDKFDHLAAASRAKTRERGVTAFLTVQEGCDKFCTFCVVPFTRGAEVSRPAVKIVAEAEALVDAGVREVTLLGQNVNAYHGAGEGGGAWTLARLIERLARVPGLTRIRYMTSHPNDMSDDLMALHGDCPALMPYLHLPVQSGSDRILRAMSRRHSADAYIDIIARARAARPDIAVSSDFIVGFPGETEEDFAATLDLIRAVGFASTFSFKYSPRPGTAAANLPAQVSDDVMRERLARLQDLAESQRQAWQSSFIGQTVDVLFERAGRQPGQMVGKTEHLVQAQAFGPPEFAGTVRRLRITDASTNSLHGTIFDGPVLASSPLIRATEAAA